MFSSREIQNRVNSGYIERVGSRLKKMRKLLSDRDWSGLKTEANHLAEGAQNFGYKDIASEVERALSVLNTRNLSRTSIDTEAKNAMEHLFQKLDRFLVGEQDS
jgi:HPt (histidine-containing phosphotransfer) domain-containing protein